jgi:hypothetical protein
MATATCDQAPHSARMADLGEMPHRILRNRPTINWITAYSDTLLRNGSQPRGGRMSVTGGFSAMPLKSRRDGHR